MQWLSKDHLIGMEFIVGILNVRGLLNQLGLMGNKWGNKYKQAKPAVFHCLTATSCNWHSKQTIYLLMLQVHSQQAHNGKNIGK